MPPNRLLQRESLRSFLGIEIQHEAASDQGGSHVRFEVPGTKPWARSAWLHRSRRRAWRCKFYFLPLIPFLSGQNWGVYRLTNLKHQHVELPWLDRKTWRVAEKVEDQGARSGRYWKVKVLCWLFRQAWFGCPKQTWKTVLNALAKQHKTIVARLICLP